MTRSPRAVTAGLLLALLLSGAAACGDDGGETAADKTDESEQSESKTVDSDSVAAGGNEEFVDGVCTAMGDWSTSLGEVTFYESGVTEPTEFAAVLEGYEAVGKSSEDALEAIEAIEASNEESEELKAELVTFFTTLTDTLDDASQDAAAIDVNAPDALSKIEAIEAVLEEEVSDPPDSKFKPFEDELSDNTNCELMNEILS